MFEAFFAMLQEGGMLAFSVAREGEKLRVVLTPRATQNLSAEHITPSVIVATPAELDREYLEALRRYSDGHKTLVEAADEVAAAQAANVKAIKEKAKPQPQANPVPQPQAPAQITEVEDDI